MARTGTSPDPDWYQFGAGLVIDFCTSPVRTGNSTYHPEQVLHVYIAVSICPVPELYLVMPTDWVTDLKVAVF